MSTHHTGATVIFSRYQPGDPCTGSGRQQRAAVRDIDWPGDPGGQWRRAPRAWLTRTTAPRTRNARSAARFACQLRSW